MSNHANKVNNPVNNANQGTNAPAPNEGTKKLSLMDRAKHLKDKVMANKIGRTAVRVVKGAAVGAVGFFGYEVGKKSVKPTFVYVEPEKPESAEPAAEEETPAEINEEETEE